MSQGYVAPEVLGLVTGIQSTTTYSNAVDMWALGCVVHELLTGEVPFVEVEYSETTITGLPLDSESEPQTNMEDLKAFCDGTTKFPTETLQRSRACHAAVELLKTMLVANPESRLTAKEALQCAWLLQDEDTEMYINLDIAPEPNRLQYRRGLSLVMFVVVCLTA